MPISAWLAPQPIVMALGQDISKFWIWRGMFLPLCFLLMFRAVASTDFGENGKKEILNLMAWIGFIIALHCIGHSLGLYQWMRATNVTDRHLIPQAGVGSFIGHPTLISPYVAMLIPIALKVKKYIFAGVMVVGVIITHSALAIGAMVVSLVYLLSRNKKCLKPVILLSALIISASMFCYITSPKAKSFMSSSGRMGMWTEIYQNFKKPYTTDKSYSYTGFGPGGFKYIYPHSFVKIREYAGDDAKPDKIGHIREAHNEYIESGWNMGLIGMALFVIGIIYFLWSMRKSCKYLYASLACILLCAGGTFVFHLGPIAFNTTLLLGLMCNQEENNGC